MRVLPHHEAGQTAVEYLGIVVCVVVVLAVVIPAGLGGRISDLVVVEICELAAGDDCAVEDLAEAGPADVDDGEDADGSAGAAGSAPAEAAEPDAGGAGGSGGAGRGGERRDLDEILALYQVSDDPDGTREYPGFPERLVTDTQEITESEARMLDDLGWLGQKDFKDIRDAAYTESAERFADVGRGAEDGHQDAFRHAYWNALMMKRFGPEFTEQIATAHERVPGNPGDKEAMDLYNNEVGRQVFEEHPDASADELADHVSTAIEGGRAVVIDADGELAYSDGVEPGVTGEADDPPADRGADPPVDDESTTGGGYDPGEPDGSGPRSDP